MAASNGSDRVTRNASACITKKFDGYGLTILSWHACSALSVPKTQTRATLIAAIARGRRWLDDLVKDPEAIAETIAHREGCSARKVAMTVSLAFLSPALVKSALEGRLPRGIGVTRLCDMPAEWSRQHRALGLDL